MPLFRRVLLGALLAFVPAVTHAQATFNGVGGSPSSVRDATKAPDSVIYAVGASGVDAMLWTWNGTSFVPTTLPNFAVGVTQVVASAITPDGAYIANQARAAGGALVASRVTRSDLTNTDLSFSGLGVPGASAGRAISDNGQILYGVVGPRIARFNAGVASLIPLTFAGGAGPATALQLAFRGSTSSDGSVMVGSVSSGGGVGGRIFRYDAATNTNTLIPAPAGVPGFSTALAVSADGNLTLFSVQPGNNPNPLTKGELYLHNAGTNAVTSLGSPNPVWSPQGFANMTSDGAVVATSFGIGAARISYFHNANGWFQLLSALASGGVDVVSAGWTHLQVNGLSSDGTLVFGRGTHGINQEGFVAEFPVDFLKNFSAPAVSPTNTAIVGAWLFPTDPGTPGNPPVLVLLADGTFVQIQTVPGVPEASGFEQGTYTSNAVTGAFSVNTRHSTKGNIAGFAEKNGILGLTASVAGDGLTLTGGVTGTRITGSAGDVVGGWLLSNPGAATPSPSDDLLGVLVLLSDGTYYLADDAEPEAAGHPGIEKGTYTWTPGVGVPLTGPFGTPTIALDTDGGWGFSTALATSFQLTPDGLVWTGTDADGSFSFTRIVDPTASAFAPVISSPLSATGVVDVLFATYAITADHAAFTFNALGLPAGLSVNTATGDISGTPTELGDFSVTITASNTLSTGSATLNLAIVNTAAGPGVLVEPAVPPGTGAVSITFTNVTQAGDTTVTVAPAGPPPPTGFGLGSPAVYYDVATTATFSGPNEICFNYAGINFGASTPRLFHNEGGAWVDVTSSLNTATTTICGTTSSFSPFVILVSTISRTGFYQPVSPVPSYLNTVKGGSTVPLAFNVYVNGIEKTDASGLVFTVASVPCSGGTEDAVDFVTTGSTELRYSGGQFIQNWKTPKGAGGCYIVRMTTTTDGGSLSAMFKMK